MNFTDVYRQIWLCINYYKFFSKGLRFLDFYLMTLFVQDYANLNPLTVTYNPAISFNICMAMLSSKLDANRVKQ